MQTLAFKTKFFLIILALGFLGIFGTLVPAYADCTTDGSTETCTGDLDPISETSSSIDTLIVEDLTDNISGDTTIELSYTGSEGGSDGDAGETVNAREVTFDGGDFGLESTEFGILIENTGGLGHTGKARTDVTSSGKGGDGGNGGASGGASATFSSGTLTTTGGVGISVADEGGPGRIGGEGKSFGSDTGEGGAGGAGGTSAGASITVETGTLKLTGETGMQAASSGGDGGAAGKGENTSGKAEGKTGGAGGDAGDTSITIGDDADGLAASITINASGGIGIEGISSGGMGGAGGEAEQTSVSNADAGTGGAGGTGGNATVTVEGGSTVNITFDAVGILAESAGNVGGDGGFASTGTGTANGGNGGAGGASSTATVNIAGSTVSVSTTGISASHAIHAKSKAGDGGGGANGDSGGTGNGGDGGDGGTAGEAVITIDSSSTVSIETTGTNSHGILAESLAGSGADAGTGTGSLTGGNGGDGGQGGTGGDVTVDVDIVLLKTIGEQSQGILARSYGGDGGEGGSGDSVTDGDPGTSKGPGPAGTVDVTFTGQISTEEDESNGILAQSVGGFSGDAGSSSGLVAYGASSQSGGDASDVTVTVNDTSSITTLGDYATGIDAQSTGGGGGKGSSASGVGALGGEGSAGGDGGAVIITVGDATISTDGDESRGISATSQGGGGGNAGSSDGVVSIGGSSGTGGDGGPATVTSSATIWTSGAYAEGIYAASIGGGGGSAKSTGGLAALGGSGGDGGDGGAATVVINDGNINTGGDYADGVFVQSVGGGGGDGSNALSISAFLSLALGSSGGSGGAGGEVNFSDSSDLANGGYTIMTDGTYAYGILAQSVGGGGGNGGNEISISASIGVDLALGASGGGGNGSNGAKVRVETKAAITTTGDKSYGVFAQSVGGGGGSSGTSITSANSVGASYSLTLGNQDNGGGSGGDGGVVAVITHGSISTSGDNSIGILAQSVGGGGGNASTSIDGSAISGASYSINIGGTGGAGGNGNTVTLDAEAGVNTSGDNSPAVMGQSVGSGGGNGGTTVAASGASIGSANISIGGDGGSGGDGGNVTVGGEIATSTTGNNSAAFIAQSIGGSGGMSGTTVSVSGGDLGDLELTIGGDGGDGGNGGTVKLSFIDNEDVTTTGDNSPGLLAQSLGGTGGAAGYAVSGDVGSGGTAAITVQGGGGDGGSSGDVTVDNKATVRTSGTYSYGVLAQSLAGGGGSATAAISVSGFSMGDVDVAVGGDGGSGGTGGTVTVTNTHGLTTTGAYASGILAQSLGGDGGTGGLAVDAGVNLGEYTGGASVTIGGDGGDGGNAGEVNVTNSGAISTGDYYAYGIFAQSIGGDGGNGGAAVAGTISVSATATADIDFTLGGSGGDGGVGNDVTVTNNSGADITTTGDLAIGILAQSLGGNGGTGGSAYTSILDIGASTYDLNIGVTVGGSGGDGAVGGDVVVQNDATIYTTGGSSSGIYAQSIGGNGGNGGVALNAIANLSSESESKSYSGSVTVAVGGNGGTGSDAGTVMVSNTGTIKTADTSAYAIFAQSVGGGGGDGGSADNYTLAATFSSGTASSDSNTSSTDWDIDVTVGGNGEGGGDGEAVTVTNSGALTTSGSAAYGIFAQSVGGGGGIGGNGELTLTGRGTNSTLEALVNVLESVDDAYEAYEDLSNFFTTWSVDVGGSGGAAGDGASVTVTNHGNITTTGGSGTAIFAQSIGGGGGTGGDGVGGLLTEVVVSGSGGGGGQGGDVTVDNTGILSTTGDGAMGIFAQSVGGGGGSSGDIETTFLEAFGDLNIGLGIMLQEDAGDGGDGGDVSVTTSGAITTAGEAAVAIYAQSIGGGGGSSGIKGFEAILGGAGSSGAEGDGGTVMVTTTDAITVTGENGVGIFAQSVSGDITGSKASDITILVGGDITATNTEGRGILAQSEGFDSHGIIAITIAEGVTVSTTADGFDTISLMHGSSNTITNNGTIEKTEGDSVNNYAIITSGGDLSVDNFGTFTGSVSLDGDFTNSFMNESGATLNLGLEFDLGSATSTLTNDGTMSPGGEGTISTSTVTGILTQSSTGIYYVDLSMGTSVGDGDSDVITLETTGASFAGTVTPNLVDDNLLASGDSDSVDIAVSDGGTITSTATVADTATIDYSVATSTNSDGDATLTLTYTVDLTGGTDSLTSDPSTGLTSENFLNLASHLDDLVEYARTSLAPTSDEYTFISTLINEILAIGTLEELNIIYGGLIAEDHGLAHFSSTLTMVNFHGALRSCPAYGENGYANFNRQGRCIWGSIQGSTFKQRDETPGRIAYTQKGFSLATGIQVARSETLYFGLGVAFDRRKLNSSSFSSETSSFQLGLVMKKLVDDWTISGTLSLGLFDGKTTRAVTTPLGSFSAQADPDGGFLSFQLQVDRVYNMDGWYVKPMAAVTLVQFWQESFSETSAGGFGFDVQSVSNASVLVHPALEVGGELFGPSSRVFVRAGAMVYVSGRTTDLNLRFSGLSVSSPLLTLTDTPDRTHGELAVGFDFDLGGGKSLSLMAEGSLSQNSHSYGGFGKFRFKF